MARIATPRRSILCAVSEGASSLGSRSTRVGYRALLPLSVFTLVLLCLLPGSAAPWAGTEGHRALPGRAMLDGGDWLVPRLVGQLYLRKPPGQYWAIASAGWVACDVTERVSRPWGSGDTPTPSSGAVLRGVRSAADRAAGRPVGGAGRGGHWGRPNGGCRWDRRGRRRCRRLRRTA